jgi:toxin ParE1/3/4
MKIIISKKAKKDMMNSYRYLKNEMMTNQSAEDLKNALIKAIKSLELFPEKGAQLNTIIDYKTEYRFLVKKNHYIFYKIISDHELHIIRVLHVRQNIVEVLFDKDKR